MHQLTLLPNGEKMKVLVTGGSGFVGQFLIKHLKKEKIEVIAPSSKECDLTKDDGLLPLASEHFDQIYHLAAWTQAGDFCLHHPAQMWLINQKIHTNMLTFWSSYQKQAKLITLGTSCAYDPQLALIEDNYLKGEPIDSLYSYAMSKRMLLVGLKSYQIQYKMNYLYCIPSTLFGPSYHTDGRQMHFIFDLMRKILEKKHFNRPCILWGDGEQKRELVHVEDFISTFFTLAQTHQNEVINIGAGQEHSIKTFANMICKRAGIDPKEIIYDETKYVGARSKVLNIEKLHRITSSFQPRPLKDGIDETLDWFENSLEKLCSH